MARSHYIAGAPLSKPSKKFEKWLRAQGYENCSDAYPAAVHASAFVDEYFREHADAVGTRDIVEHHAEAIGWLSNYEADDEDDSEFS